MGIVSMAWVPSIPEIKEANGLTDTQFGLALIASYVGAIFGAQLSGKAVHRFGSRTAMCFSQLAIPAGSVAMRLRSRVSYM